MAMSVKFTVVLTIFLLLGIGIAGLFMQPHVSYDAWNINQSSFPANASSEEKLTFLVGYSILAPSSHNTQPWKFNVSKDRVDLYADKSRWLQFADADRRELRISLGCALENLLVAAEHFGYEANVTYLNEGDLVARVTLVQKSLPSQDSRLIDAIVARKTNRNAYLDRPVPETELQKLQNITEDFTKDRSIQFYLTSDPEIRNKFRDLEVQADQTLYADANYKSELGHWLGQGVLGPTGVQALATQLAVVFLDVGPEETRKDAELVNNTPVLGFISNRRKRQHISDKSRPGLRAVLVGGHGSWHQFAAHEPDPGGAGDQGRAGRDLADRLRVYAAGLPPGLCEARRGALAEKAAKRGHDLKESLPRRLSFRGLCLRYLQKYISARGALIGLLCDHFQIRLPINIPSNLSFGYHRGKLLSNSTLSDFNIPSIDLLPWVFGVIEF